MENNNSQKPLVAVWSFVYNHEPYLRDYFEGIIMQKTSFPFIAIVHDDCSTDRSATIIKEYAEKYPDIIKPIFETENQYSKKNGSLDRIMYEAINASGAKYIALCEGDDYWIDPLKLQKQVDILEENNNIGMVYSQAKILVHKTTELKGICGSSLCSFENIIKQNPIPTLTTMFTIKIYNEYIKKTNSERNHWLMGDYPLWLYISSKSKIKFLDEITGVYRILNSSASHPSNYKSQLLFSKSGHELRKYALNNYWEKDPSKFELEKEIIDVSIANIDLRLSLIENNKDSSIKYNNYLHLILNNKIPFLYKLKNLPWILFPKLAVRYCMIKYNKIHG